MAAGICRLAKCTFNLSPLISCSLKNNLRALAIPANLSRNQFFTTQTTFLASKLNDPFSISVRHTSFYNRISGTELWKGVTSVSNAGKKRGRGKGVGKKTAKNLNRGQVIGVGKVNMVWPGLNSPIIQGKELVQQKKVPEDPEYMSKLIALRDKMGAIKSQRLSPLERGWSSTKLPGRSIGAPDPVGEDTFDGFDTKVLEFKTVCNMKGNLGRTRRVSSFVITGNGNGLAGFAIGKAQMGTASLRKAKNRAAQKLMYFERYNEHTVLHDFFTQFGKSRIFVQKRPEGYGLVCHRAIRTVCEVIGIKDLHAKVEGPTKNIQNITRAFIVGLLQQKTFDQIAEDTKLNVVELRKERDNFPQVVASPSQAIPVKDPLTDFNLYIMNGRVPTVKRKVPKFFERLPSWQVHLSKTLRFRNHKDVRTELLSEHGEVRSFLADKYPECRRTKFVKKREEDDS